MRGWSVRHHGPLVASTPLPARGQSVDASDVCEDLDRAAHGRWSARPSGCLAHSHGHAARATEGPRGQGATDRRRGRRVPATSRASVRDRQQRFRRRRWRLPGGAGQSRDVHEPELDARRHGHGRSRVRQSHVAHRRSAGRTHSSAHARGTEPTGGHERRVPAARRLPPTSETRCAACRGACRVSAGATGPATWPTTRSFRARDTSCCSWKPGTKRASSRSIAARTWHRRSASGTATREATGKATRSSSTRPTSRPNSYFMGSTERLHLVERFTRTAPDTITYEMTISDPTTWVKPWTAMMPMRSQAGNAV